MGNASATWQARLARLAAARYARAAGVALLAAAAVGQVAALTLTAQHHDSFPQVLAEGHALALTLLALAATVPLAIALRAHAGLMILPTAPLLVLAAVRGPRQWWPVHPDRPPPPNLARNTALISAACAYGLLAIEAIAGAF